jgi:membrane protein
MSKYPFLWSFVKLCISFRRLKQASAALTYHTIFAIVPVMSLLVAIAKGLGYDEEFRQQVYLLLKGQEDISEKLLLYANSYLDNAQMNIWLGVGIGVVLLLYSVISIFQTIDETFNFLWKVERRSYTKLLKIYSFILVIPILSVLLTGLWWSVSSYLNGKVLHELNTMFFSVIAYTLILFVIYTLVPNTKVRKKYAAISASICGLIFASMQYLSYSIISMFNSYKSIYGDLATMIVFLLWIYYAWTICLAGSKWNYYLQNADVRERERNYDRISTDCFTFISLLVIERIECMYPMCHEFDTNDLTKNVHRIYNIPISIIHKVLNSFKDRKILWNKNNNKVCLNYNFSNLSVEELLYKLNTKGINGDVLMSLDKGMGELWESINHKEINVLKMSVRNILERRY